MYFLKKIFNWKTQPGVSVEDEESCYKSDQDDHPLESGDVLGKYVLTKEVTDYLPKSGNDTITEERGPNYFPTHGNGAKD